MLKTMRSLIGLTLHAPDGIVGRVTDICFDEERWNIRYLVVGTRNGLPRPHVLFSTEWITGAGWADSNLFTDLPRHDIETSPECPDDLSIPRDFEERLFQHFGRPGYWSGGRPSRSVESSAGEVPTPPMPVPPAGPSSPNHPETESEPRFGPEYSGATPP